MSAQSLPLNTIAHGDCLEFLRSLPDECIDTVITSPPYAQQRKDTYGGVSSADFVEWFVPIAKEIKRVLKPSGSFVLNIKEHVTKGARDTYVYRLVLELSEFLIWSDTYIWHKLNPFPTGLQKRLKDGFEYCYLFTKTLDHKFRPDNVLVESKMDEAERERELRRKNKGMAMATNGSGLGMNNRYISD